MRRSVALIQEGSLYGLLFLLPFSKAALEILFGCLLVTWLVARLDPATRTDTMWLRPSLQPLLYAGAAFLAACALSVVVSTDVGLSVRGFTRKWLEYLMLFVIITDVGSRPGVAQRSLSALALSALFVVIEGISQERYGSGFFRGNYRLDFFQRMTGPYENPIDLATYLMVIIPPLIVYALSRHGAARWRRWTLTVAVLLCLARTSSLGSWFGLGTGLLVISRWRTAMRRYVLTVLAVAVVMAGGFLVGTGRLHYIFSLSAIGKLDRVAMWQAAIGMIADRPILGHGVNTFMAHYLHYWVGGEYHPRYAHNCYLQMWAETGIVGLGMFLWLLRGLLNLWGRAIRRLSDGPHRYLLLGLMAGLVAFLAQAAIDTNFYAMRQAFLFWTLAGVATGLAAGSSPHLPTAMPSDR